MQLYNAESRGMSVDKVTPHIYKTARRIWGIYFFFTLLEAVLLIFGVCRGSTASAIHLPQWLPVDSRPKRLA